MYPVVKSKSPIQSSEYRHPKQHTQVCNTLAYQFHPTRPHITPDPAQGQLQHKISHRNLASTAPLQKIRALKAFSRITYIHSHCNYKHDFLRPIWSNILLTQIPTAVYQSTIFSIYGLSIPPSFSPALQGESNFRFRAQQESSTGSIQRQVSHTLAATSTSTRLISKCQTVWL